MKKDQDTNTKMIQVLEITDKYLKEANIKMQQKLWMKWNEIKKMESVSKETGDKNQMQILLLKNTTKKILKLWISSRAEWRAQKKDSVNSEIKE